MSEAVQAAERANLREQVARESGYFAPQAEAIAEASTDRIELGGGSGSLGLLLQLFQAAGNPVGAPPAQVPQVNNFNTAINNNPINNGAADPNTAEVGKSELP